MDLGTVLGLVQEGGIVAVLLVGIWLVGAGWLRLRREYETLREQYDRQVKLLEREMDTSRDLVDQLRVAQELAQTQVDIVRSLAPSRAG